MLHTYTILISCVFLIFSCLFISMYTKPERFNSYDFSSLQVHESPFPLIRIGRNHDGGYAICKDFTYDGFISGGINDDISFEEHFISLYPNLICYAFDGTIEDIPPTLASGNIKFTKKNIGGYNNDSLTNLHDIIDNHRELFVKMDIEGGEYDWLESLSPEQMSNIKQLVIEFHKILDDPKRLRMIEKLSKTHWLVHYHANNYGGLRVVDGITIPDAFECTYINKKLVNTQTLPCNNTPIPDSSIDQINNPQSRDIALNHYPYVCAKK